MKQFLNRLKASSEIQIRANLIDRLEKFIDQPLKKGRMNIKGFPVDVYDNPDGDYVEMDAVDREVASGLIALLRKNKFKAKRHGNLGILIEE